MNKLATRAKAQLQKKTGKKGFTLVEVIVVLVILAILAALLIPFALLLLAVLTVLALLLLLLVEAVGLVHQLLLALDHLAKLVQHLHHFVGEAVRCHLRAAGLQVLQHALHLGEQITGCIA